MIEPGETYVADVPIARLHTRTSIEMPIIINRSTKPGPSLLLSAGIHGDELNGVAIIRRLIAQEDLVPERGTIIAIPLLNVFGFLYGMRNLPDGKDMNRSFPGQKNGSLASQMANFLSEEILPQIDYGIDFHTGSGSKQNHPQVRWSPESPEAGDLARAFAPPFILKTKFRNNSLRQVADDQGKPLIIYEGGESQRFDQYSIECGVRGIHRVLSHLGLLKSNHSGHEHDVIELDKSSWLRARHSGLFMPTIKNGSCVQKEEVMGVITDPYGKFEHRVRANREGYVIAVNYEPTVNKGDALVHIGWVQ